jgi:cytochrome oxidase Cu insertion factor (SCO1/SenC/PrrC family)
VRLYVLCVLLLLSGCAPLSSVASPTSTPATRENPFTRPIRSRAPFLPPPVIFTDQDGQSTTLDALKPRVTVLYVSNIVCIEADACIEGLPRFAQLKRDLGSRADGVAFVMIGLDPTSDTPAALKTHVDAVDPDFFGWTAPLDMLRPFSTRLGIHTQQISGTWVAHTNMIYALDRQGRVRSYISDLVPPERLLADVTALLDE